MIGVMKYSRLDKRKRKGYACYHNVNKGYNLELE